MKIASRLPAAASTVPRFGRALAIKVALPLSVAGATLLSGAAVAVPSLAASADSAPVVASAAATGAVPGMYHG
jgi:hypothetical protein